MKFYFTIALETTMTNEPTDIFKKELFEKFKKTNQNFGRGSYYQGFEPWGIPGQRPTKLRFDTYKLRDILSKDQDVLDIGCNVGFFDNYISEFVKSVDGIDFNEKLIEIANDFKKHTGCQNANFFVDSFEKFNTQKTYDVVLSLAIHWHLQMTFENYINKIDSILNSGGYLLIESHDPYKEDSDWKQKINYIISKNYSEVSSGNIKDDNKIYRVFNILKKA